MGPLVSIIIPAYNAQKYLAQTIESCLAQTDENIEIIVVDDGSGDDTARIAGQYLSVRYVHQENAGPAKARNTGVAHAKGQFILFLDADDILLPPMVARCLREFEQHPDLELVYTDYERRTEDFQGIATEVPRAPIKTPPDEILDVLLYTSSSIFPIHCALIRAEVVRAVGGFDAAIISTEDWHFWVRVAARGTHFHHIDEPLVWYRVVAGSLSLREIRFSEMRLKAYQHLRGVELPPKYDLEQLIAGRHHALAIKLWQHDRRAEAREQLRLAIATHPANQRGRQFLILASYLLPFTLAERLLTMLQRLGKPA